MAIRRFSTAEPGVKSNKFWDQDTQQGAIVPLGSVNMSGTATAFGFGSIPQTYQDLMIVASIRSNSSAGAGWIVNNSAGGMTYGVTTLKGDGASATSTRGSSMSYGASQIGALGSSSGTPATMITHFLNYTSTTTKKTWIQRTSCDLGGSGFTGVEVFANNLTGAITDLACSTANGSIFWYGTATLYGIKAGA
jgi:hypothetical protein